MSDFNDMKWVFAESARMARSAARRVFDRVVDRGSHRRFINELTERRFDAALIDPTFLDRATDDLGPVTSIVMEDMFPNKLIDSIVATSRQTRPFRKSIDGIL